MKFDDARKLQQKKYRSQSQHFLVEGEHLLQELIRAAAHQPDLLRSEVFLTDKYAGLESPFKTHEINERQMKLLSETKSPQGMVAVVPFIKPTTSHSSERAVYLWEVQDPGNLGTIIRTLVWFGGFRLLLSPGSVDPYNGKVVRSSMGGIFHLPIETDVPLESLKGRFSDTACLDMAGKPLSGGGFTEHDCYLFGNEARGVPVEALNELGATAYTIPGSGQIESLNLASAVNLSVWEINR